MCKVENYDEKSVYTYFFPPLTQTQWGKKVWYTLCVFVFYKKQQGRREQISKAKTDTKKEIENRKQE